MTKKEVEYQAYLFLRENGMEYAMNASELIETCRDFAYPIINYFQKEIKELKKENAKLNKDYFDATEKRYEKATQQQSLLV